MDSKGYVPVLHLSSQPFCVFESLILFILSVIKKSIQRPQEVLRGLLWLTNCRQIKTEVLSDLEKLVVQKILVQHRWYLEGNVVLNVVLDLFKNICLLSFDYFFDKPIQNSFTIDLDCRRIRGNSYPRVIEFHTNSSLIVFSRLALWESKGLEIKIVKV